MFRPYVPLLRIGLGLLLSSGLAGAYDYPFSDPYVATVVSTPEEYAEVLPAQVPTINDSIRMFPKRKVPGILWHLSELRYSYIRQDGPAPLIFLVAGTGASFGSSKMQIMQKAFYQAGYHVVSLSSPTHPNFIVAASTSGVPGHLVEDSADLYHLMQAIRLRLQRKLEVTDFYLTGYSLGATQAAFIAKLDEQEQLFNFSKVLLINPPVSLYNSMRILDEILAQNIPGGPDNTNTFYQRMVGHLAEVYARGEAIEFNDQFLYKAYQQRESQNAGDLKALIGIDFRISSGNMVFTSDVLTKAGYVVPKNLILKRHDRATIFLKALSRLSFLDYFHGILLPHFQAQNPQRTESELIEALSLRSIDSTLRNASKIGLIHNQDDVILQPGEIDYLRELFGSRARIFPSGGHCGNMAYPDNIATMLGFFQAVGN